MKPSDPESLRDLAETLDGCEWNHPLGSADLCRCAAAEIEYLRVKATEFVGQVVARDKEIEVLREFVEDQPCECLDEYGAAKPHPCERCRLLGRREDEEVSDETE